MPDVKIDQSQVQDVKDGFARIRTALSLRSDDSMDASSENIGQADLVAAVTDFNLKADKMKRTYEKKTKRFVDYLQTVLDESDKLDSGLASSAEFLDSEKNAQKAEEA
ncbi:MAG: hypothetical protein ACFNZJ_00425 [Parascardovia denticolens]|uniref:hypothetical protein n=1 Tax=Parascardovia denticolens TaxID=78258 RepID=UPI00248DAB28|nr:hypothetical protein [Parascardovia denticolens]